uniref:non-specific serine/threonine protein kinase n=3 Tax=Noccaea caerulescens TaxID=107243 RepID=A0A1J3GGU8_NOCCA
MESHHFLLFLSLFLPYLPKPGSGFGSSGPIAASFGGSAFFCAIDASGRQEVICWGKNYSSPSSPYSSSPSLASSASQSYNIPSMAVLSGGDGFLCGILSNTSQAFCFSSLGSSSSGMDLVPLTYRTTAYSQIAAGNSHVCAVRGAYYSDHDSGTVDCWEITKAANNTLIAKENPTFYDQIVSNFVFNKIVSGDGFSCGGIREGGLLCFGPNSSNLGLNTTSDNFETLAAGKNSLCAIVNSSREVKCWGDDDSFANSRRDDSRFVALTAGPHHFCGIREDNHEVECWGNSNFSLIPKGSGFKAIASSDFIVCGIREEDLVLDCWLVNGSSTLAYDPPLELCSPGICRAGPCNEREFAFNASILNEPDLTSLCVRKELMLCSPCGSDCSRGFFLSSPCTENSDRICTPCSLCQNSSCSDICKLHNNHNAQDKHWHQMQRLVLIIGSCASALLIITIGCCVVPRIVTSPNKEESTTNQFKSCIGKTDLDTEPLQMVSPVPSVTPFAQVFRLSELKDATNGFKEFNELGRGSYGFVYKAVLADGRQVAVKRANAATIIHTNTREFETELEILCNIRHCNIVNLLGYSTEMGERLLVYEYMPHGTLHDHLHGGFSPLNWSLRIKIAMQTAKGLEYLHVDSDPRIVHGDVKSSNVLLDLDWVARVADFGLVTTSSNDKSLDIKRDVYDFGVVLLEILTGRKRYDREYDPAEIVDWAVPVIREGKAAAIVDKYIALPRNVEPLLKLADVAELCVREDPIQRPTMSELVNLLEQVVRDGLVL